MKYSKVVKGGEMISMMFKTTIEQEARVVSH